ncbi:hypothetical protein M2282_003715 [Variovorax boronicumulans]|uniref:hypothetical protein n=1 Tax=Variovorax boronicumulans TaxID=436515 RepID=UPI00247404E1|nr:hypothetical protein [Variovorax boronicumulans]MDH6168562.1 hypothetical protein [Variovorax boronicumulans]
MIQRLSRSRFFRFATGLVAGAALLAACTQMPQNRAESAALSATPSAAPAAPAPAQLGTQWGEGIESKTRTVVTRRLSEQPDEVASIGYNEASAVRREVGNNPERRLNLQLAQGDVEWSVLDENDRPLPLQRARRSSGNDMFRLAGVEGARYTLRFRNLSDRSYEVIATVDGLDVLTGKPGSLRNGGYVLRPQETLNIEGFRKSQSEVAAFRFATPGRAYAANTETGDVRNIGVIGAALFELEQPQAPRRPRRDATPPQPSAFPADGAYAPPPRYRK